MNKSELKAIFINAKATDAKYIGVSITSVKQELYLITMKRLQ